MTKKAHENISKCRKRKGGRRGGFFLGRGVWGLKIHPSEVDKTDSSDPWETLDREAGLSMNPQPCV